MEVDTEFVEQVLKDLKLRTNPLTLNTRSLSDEERTQIASAVVGAWRLRAEKEQLSGNPTVGDER